MKFSLIRLTPKHLMMTFATNVGRSSQHFSYLLSPDGYKEFEALDLKPGDAIPEDWEADCTQIAEAHLGQSSYNKNK